MVRNPELRNASLGMAVTPEPMRTFVSEVIPAKAEVPMLVTASGIERLVMLVAPLKAESPIRVTPLGIAMLESGVLENALLPIIVWNYGSVTETTSVLAKALTPIVATRVPRVTLRSAEASMKAMRSIRVTPSPITTLSNAFAL